MIVCLLLQSQNALIIDSVYMYAKALNNYLNGLDDFETMSISCGARNSDNVWAAGESIYNQMLSVCTSS